MTKQSRSIVFEKWRIILQGKKAPTPTENLIGLAVMRAEHFERSMEALEAGNQKEFDQEKGYKEEIECQIFDVCRNVWKEQNK